MPPSAPTTSYDGSEIAIVGMACRFPGADDVEQFWRNLRDGVESLSRLSDEELAAAGVPAALARGAGYVRAASVLDGIEMFDAGFFGYTPLEAKLMDPQQRLFLECAWEAFELAGYDPERSDAPVGVFTGAKTNTYLFSLFADRELWRSLDHFQIALGNDLAAMATRVSHRLNLRGPSYALHTACSTSLVAVHLACQSLLLGECRMALAGGAAINVPQRRGYLAQRGGLLSPDGSTRTFDARAAGSNFGNGVGAVLLKRLEDALADGDAIHALIRGSATNNDGAAKASFTAPGVEGQTAVLLEAMANAGVDAPSLSYVEAHGTATELGDAIELLALGNAWRAAGWSAGGGAAPARRCAIGSVKTNLGHLETAAGVAGLIKTALALEHRQIPPSLHYATPNPRLGLDASPFYVNTRLVDWPAGEGPRRAGVSSFGIGSTNAHVILEEAPAAETAAAPSRDWQLLVLSARSPAALDRATANLARHLAEHPEIAGPALADVAYTLSVGRKPFAHRRTLVWRGADADIAAPLGALEPGRVLTHRRDTAGRAAVFLFPGLGEHHPGMGRGLYGAAAEAGAGEPRFRAEIDRCAALLLPLLGVDVRDVLYSPEAAGESGAAGGAALDLRRMLGRGGPAGGEAGRDGAGGGLLDRTWIAQPALFAVEYALAQVWISWGIRPQAMAGYSLGEYVAACLAGVLTLPDALRLVAERARLIETLPAGDMLAVALAEAEVAPLLAAHGLSLAAVNGPAGCVAAGNAAGIAALAGELAERGVACRRLPTTHPFHAAELAPLAAPLTALARSLTLSPPRIPYLSNVTGDWITAEQATDPGYWARHMCQTVRFGDALGRLLGEGGRLLLEVGPGQGLGSFARQHPACDDAAAQATFASLPGPYGGQEDQEVLLTTLGKLWLLGQPIDWHAFWSGQRRRRARLPTYPFERQRHWVDAPREDWGAEDAPPAGGEPASAAAVGEVAVTAASRRVTLDKQTDPADWLYRPVWRETPLPAGAATKGPWLILGAETPLGVAAAARLRQEGSKVVAVAEPPAGPAEYEALLAAFEPGGDDPLSVLHMWSTAAGEGDHERLQELGFYSLLWLAQALGRRRAGRAARIVVVASQLHRVTGDESLAPAKATLLGPCRVIPQELAGVSCVSVDVEPAAAAAPSSEAADRLAGWLLAEAPRSVEPDGATLVAYRGGAEARRFVQDFAPVRPDAAADRNAAPRLRDGGVYLLTGGLGGIGLALAEHLARTLRGPRLVLTGRAPLPPPEEWDAWLASHPPGDRVSGRLRRLRRIEELGAQVMAVAADAAEIEPMREVVAAARRRFGAVHGVVHLAGVPGGGIIQLKTRAAAARIMAPKVAGARVLDALFPHAGDLEVLVLFSSIAAILGEIGQADYCGANAYLDAVAQRNAMRGWPATVTVDSDIWRQVGLATETAVPAHLEAWRAEMLAQALTPEEGADAVIRALACGVPQVVISAQPLAGRIELGRSFTAERFLAEMGAPPTPGRRVMGTRFAGASGSIERRIAAIWQRLLGVEQVGVHDNFFDLGGNSLLGLQVVSEVGRELGAQVAPVTLFESPTVAALARHIAREMGADAPAVPPASPTMAGNAAAGGRDIAIVAMAGRFPGAGSVEELWGNLRAGVESVRFFTDEELAAAGVDPALAADPRYVRAGAVLDGIDLFDAGLFGFSPREAEITDPQHRVFLECAWEALERAGCDPATFPGAIGVFAGANLSTYLLRMVTDPGARASVNLLQAILGNDKDSLTTTVSYRLGLRGPSLAVQTFCSTSLVAVHLACRSLRGGECDMALAGGVRIVVPDRQGYLYEHGGLAPADGHSRSFDARANGSVLGHGAAVVCLKRLADALADGDTVLAVIKGSAINNDGAEKAGFTAPSVNGQAAAIAAAFADAGVEPESVSYVEAHGSATELGDPIEVAALTKAFRRFTPRSAWCPIGSVKSNFGHLDRAAGVTGLIKTVLALEHEELPPSINFERPNPQIDFAASPFFVNAELRPWSRGETPRRASVNSLGIGGTNVHVVVEEAPLPVPGTPSRPWQLLLLSAKTPAALDAVTGRLRGWLEERPEIDPLTFADAAYTLKVGRRALPWRRALVCRDAAEAAAALAAGDPQRLLAGDGGEREPAVVFAFAGLGGQYVDMGRGLYDSEPVFRATVDECAAALAPRLGLDLRQRLYPAAPGGDKDAERGGAERPALDLRRMLAGRNGDDERSEAERLLDETRFAQPALFVVELALARLLASWGIRPQVVLGYSLGEITAACVAGVLALPDALALTAERARRIAELPAGAMLAVGLPADELLALLGPDLSLAAINGPEQSVAAGAPDAVAALAARLDERGVAHRSLRTTHAFHSRQMEALFDGTVELLAGIDLHPPAIPMLSNVTGTWLTADEATDPAYWARHMCQPVRFSDSIAELCAEPDRLVVEIGPGKALGSLILQHPASRSGHEPPIVAPLRHSYETRFAGADQAYALEALGRLWLLGVRPDWKGFHAGERRRRRQLPTYPFERQRYWVETGGAAHLQGAEASPAGGALGGGGAAGSVEPGAALYLPSWRRLPLAAAQSAGAAVSLDTLWLLLADDRGLGQQLATRLTAAGQRVVCARRAAARIEGDLQEVAPGVFEIAPGAAAFAALLGALPGPPAEIVHLWGLDSEDTPESTARELAAIQALAEALAGAPRSFWLVTRQAQAIESGETPRPAAAALAGAGGLVASRLPGCAWRVVDVATPPAGSAGTAAERRLIAQLAAELTSGAAEPLVAYRGAHRWVSGVEPLVLPSAAAAPPRAAAGACLLSGGLGVEGFPVAAWLARRTGARLVLLENAGFPPREEWQERLTGAGTRGDESVAARIRRALRLEELGAELLIGSAEPSDAVAVGALVAQAEARWGALTGIVHVAERQSDATLGLATGMQTLLALDAVRRRSGARLAWLVMPPAAGIPLRLFADALAEASADDEHDGAPGGSGWTSLTWGLDASAEPDGHLEPAGSVLDRLRASDETGPVVLVSPLPLPQGWNRLGELPAAAAAGAAAPPPRAAGVGLYPRPGLRVAYAPPRDEMERVVAGFWEELLGVAQVGIHDNFLDLGGDSLLATRLVARLRDALEVELPVRLLFERSTVAELAAAVAERRGEQVSAETDELVESIRGLSESEIEAEIVRLESIMANEEMLNG